MQVLSRRLKPYFRPLLAIVIGIAMLGGVVRFGQKARGLDDSALSPWLSIDSPTLDKISDLPAGQQPPHSIDGNRDCEYREIVIRPATPLQSKQSTIGCVVDTAFGVVSTGGSVQRPGTIVSGPTMLSSGVNFTLMPIPLSTTALNLYPGPSYGSYARFIHNLDAGMSTKTQSDGTVQHTIFSPVERAISDNAQNKLAIDYSSIAFSPDGQWMVADAPSIGAIRVEVATGKVLPFGPSFNYGVGLSPSLQTAITSDGRYAAIASLDFNIFRLYDLSTCAVVPDQITSAVTCSYKDLRSFMQQQVSGFKGVTRLRFRDNYTLEYYVGYMEDTITRISYYTLTAAGQASSGFQYLGLGDSFASGEGAYQYKAATDIDNNKCHLSLRSYPYLIASDLGLNKYASVACSGAKIEDIISQSLDYTGQTKQKIPFKDITNLDEVMSSLDPGHIAQFRFVEKYKPSVITISTVGNDIGFSDKIKRCLEPDTCYASYEDRLELVREINAQFDHVVAMYNNLKKVGDPRAKIYVIGYPQIAKADGNCGDNVHFNNDEIIFSNNLVTYLNTVVRAAADKAGVKYVDVEHALDGHRLCETVYSDTAVNGLTAGKDAINILGVVKGPLGNESYHPNALGHQKLALMIAANTNNFTDPMPAPNASATYPGETSGLAIMNARASGRKLYRASYDDEPGNDVVVRQGWWQTVLTSAKTVLQRTTSIGIFLNSDPVHLGDSTVGDDGSATVSVQIPADTQPGFHVVHMYAVDVTGQPVDFYKSIYVAASDTDYDGDGVPNAQDSCPTTTPAGVDVDMDGIDDACDGDIGPPPSPSAVTFTALAAGAKVGGQHAVITVDATDDRGVQKVQFILDGNNLGDADTDAPYAVDWDTTTVANGEHTLAAVATNLLGLTTTITTTVMVYNNTPPVVTITEPLPDSVLGGSVPVTVDATDNSQVAGVRIQVDGHDLSPELLTAPYTLDWDTKVMTNGQHTLTITARDDEGLTTTVTSQITVYNLPPPPTIDITSPTNGSVVNGSVTITASAQDAEGIAGVQFKLDGSNLGGEDTTAPYEYSLDTKSLTNGSHTIDAIARSVNGQTGSTSVTINVQNQVQTTVNPVTKLVQTLVLIVVKIVTTILRLFKR